MRTHSVASRSFLYCSNAFAIAAKRWRFMKFICAIQFTCECMGNGCLNRRSSAKLEKIRAADIQKHCDFLLGSRKERKNIRLLYYLSQITVCVQSRFPQQYPSVRCVCDASANRVPRSSSHRMHRCGMWHR